MNDELKKYTSVRSHYILKTVTGTARLRIAFVNSWPKDYKLML